MILDKYDLDSITKYFDQLEDHIYEKSDKNVRLIIVTSESSNGKLCVQSSLSKRAMFSLLLMAITEVTPDVKEIKTSAPNYFKQLIDLFNKLSK